MLSCRMKATRYSGLINGLIAVMLFSAVAPCSLLEVGAASYCTTEDTLAASTADDFHSDCCAACLTCCASSLEPPALRPFAPCHSVTSHVLFLERGPLASPFSIWHPPRL